MKQARPWFARLQRSSQRRLRQRLSWLWRRLRWLQHKISSLKQSYWHPRSQRFKAVAKILLSLVLCLICIRLIPYFVPISANQIQQDDQAVEFLDLTGLPLGTLLTRDQEHTAVVSLDQVSPIFLQAILAAEDRRFYQHGAIDALAITRAIRDTIQARKIVSGASTVTMQLARMLEPTSSTLLGKTQEIWLAWRIWAGMSRSQILQAYINRLPMGGNIYGVEAASRVYFGIPARDLNLAQASLLAGLPNDPTRLNPYDHWPALKQRQAYVLDRMVKAGYISQVQHDRAWNEAISLQPRQQGIFAAPHFLFWIAQHLPKHHPEKVQTTIDLSLQKFVETQTQAILAKLADHNVHQASALVIDNHSGHVLAYVGSSDYFDSTHHGQTDGVQALRQPGSTLKPFLYELALEKRIIQPNTVLADVPTYYAIPGAKLYSPTDYSETFQGPVRVRIALANSLNVPAVRVLEKVGVATFLDRLHQLGFAHLKQPPEFYGLGLTLGSGEVSLWELAHAYWLMARQGKTLGVNPGLDHTTIATLHPIAYTRYSASTWALITDMLSDRHARAKSFGVDSLLSLPFPSAVKTGTSSDFRDTWTVGFTADYTVATWVGNFTGEPMRQISGITGAAPLWNRIMLHLHEHRDPDPLPPVEGLVQRPICALSGLRPTPACPTVVQEYFYPEDLATYDRSFDTFYQATGKSDQVKLKLPSEYDEWLALQSQALPGNELRIVSPRNGDYFVMPSPEALNPTDRPQATLELKLAKVPQQPVEWRINGQPIATQTQQSLFWPLHPGNWTVEVKQGHHVDQVQFQVGQSIDRPSRRGFSLKR